MMRVGLFGGTFDPVHNGHLRVAEEVREHFRLERLYFIPALAQPLKQRIKVTAAADRLKMVEMATRSNKFFHVSPVEIRRGGLSYSIETIHTFAERYGDVYFLVGLDAFSEIDRWKSYKRIFEQAHLVILVRPMHTSLNHADLFPPDVKRDVKKIDDATYEHRSGKRIFFHRVTQLDVSSTIIRQLTHRGASIKYLVPYVVERFIKQGGLYTE
ncbi:MAG TPA: nicotinate-nucleotide adenylyltransferase [Syntrophorhabdales bacterium]|nr:nicotinate-nucleotide adenylyltransferase [Syntrophorhabdales bacterium]